MRPTGKLHLGHLEGVLRNWNKLQDEYECFFFVADWHALTDNLDTRRRVENISQMVIDWLSVGIDPGKCTIFVQSDVHRHAELHLLLSMATPVAWLERCPTFKDKLDDISPSESPSYGLLGYPVLQTSDIIIYKAELVPVGEDQVAHLEIAREIVRRFNGLYGRVFPEPQPLLSPSPKLPGLDGRKMSKSYNNSILISDTEGEIRKKVRTMITDPARVYRKDKGHPDVCNIFSYYRIFSPGICPGIKTACADGSIGCADCKVKLSDILTEYLAPVHERRKEFENRNDLIRNILHEGALRAGAAASKTMDEVNRVMLGKK